jgi:hypothetical protein
VADDPGLSGAPPQEGPTPAGAQGLEADDAGSGTPGQDSTRRQLRRRANFRGHIVVDDDEPLPVFDAPADPLPALLADPDGTTSQG